MQLSDEQQEIVDAILSSEEMVQILGGYAGTGKTTIICALAEKLPEYAVCAYTGKAAHVLVLKGCAATTIHRLIYVPVDTELAVQTATEYLERLERQGASQKEIDRALDALREAQEPRFVRRDKLPDGVDGIIVDESSMVPESIYRDLLSFEVPLIFVGDHGQLPPIRDKNGSPFNLMADPMFRLETIHRNAGPISYYAEHLRKGGSPQSYGTNGNVVQVLGRSAATTKLLLSADQVICAFNGTRVHCNGQLRDALGRSSLLVVGDRVICLRNAYYDGLFNGMQGTVTRIDWDLHVMDFVDDTGDLHVNVEFDPEEFGKEKYVYRRGGPHPFWHAYAITCHRAQGSEWPHVLVLDQSWQDQYARWSYTAASRARDRLTWITAR
jgi:exodeoxyribonuclease-5